MRSIEYGSEFRLHARARPNVGAVQLQPPEHRALAVLVAELLPVPRQAGDEMTHKRIKVHQQLSFAISQEQRKPAEATKNSKVTRPRQAGDLPAGALHLAAELLALQLLEILLSQTCTRLACLQRVSPGRVERVVRRAQGTRVSNR